MISKDVFAIYARNFIFGVEDSLVSTVGLLSGVVAGGVIGSGFATPNIVNNASFETGWDGMHGFGSTGPPQLAFRDNTRAYTGSWSAKRTLTVNSSSDTGGGLDAAFYSNTFWFTPDRRTDRLWTRFYMYLDGSFDGIHKFHQLYGAAGYSPQFGGLYLTNNYLRTFLAPENDGINGGSGVGGLVPQSSLVGAWHCIEMDYWRNGDPSGYPSVAIWIDGVQITSFATGGPQGPTYWDNGRINFGVRSSTEKIGVAHFLGTQNGNTGSIERNVWLDDVAVSTLGRIGCVAGTP